jgi:hypothetical protein
MSETIWWEFYFFVVTSNESHSRNTVTLMSSLKKRVSKLSICSCITNSFGAFFFCEPAWSLRDNYRKMTPSPCKQAMNAHILGWVLFMRLLNRLFQPEDERGESFSSVDFIERKSEDSSPMRNGKRRKDPWCNCATCSINCRIATKQNSQFCRLMYFFLCQL